MHYDNIIIILGRQSIITYTITWLLVSRGMLEANLVLHKYFICKLVTNTIIMKPCHSEYTQHFVQFQSWEQWQY